MTIRQACEERERLFLSVYATKSADSLGRMVEEPQCDIRTDFQRDRDRILHSKAFRRLKHKTQVFLAPKGDHYRTRLTHTLEVSQIARTIARALLMNEDLTEAVALGHDLGHTPFGHAGEAALNKLLEGGFRHYEQSLRVVDILEKSNSQEDNPQMGLNLTAEVRDGILNHARNNIANTPEGQIVKFADRIAYINHDIDDALRAGVITPEDIPKDCTDVLSTQSSKRVNRMITAIVEVSSGKPYITMQDNVLKAMMDLRAFMFERVYLSEDAKPEEKKIENIIESLYEYFLVNPPFPKDSDVKWTARDACDYIAGMTDNYAIEAYKRIFLPTCRN